MTNVVLPYRLRASAVGGVGAWALAIVVLALTGCADRNRLGNPFSIDVSEKTPAEVAPPGTSISGTRWLPILAPQTAGQPGANPAWPPGFPGGTAGGSGNSPEGRLAQATEEIPAPDPVGVLSDAAASGMSLEEAVLEALKCDPTLRAGAEAIHQAEADFETSRLPPNPTMTFNGTYIPLRPFTALNPGGPPELDVIAGYPVDWFLFGKRAAAIGSAKLGVCVSTADYADLVRQRVSGAIAAFYDVLEARSMLDMAR